LESPSSENEDSDGMVTTQDKIEAFAIVKTIVRPEIEVSRVFIRDSKISCSIIFDDNQREPLIKLFFNDSSKKRIALFNDRSNKKAHLIPVTDVFEIYEYAESIIATLKNYLSSLLHKETDEGPGDESAETDEAGEN
jgi:hypothetical protein